MTMTAWPVHTHENLFYDKKKKGKDAIIQLSLQFYGIIYSVKTIPLCKEMARLPFQKYSTELNSFYRAHDLIFTKSGCYRSLLTTCTQHQ